MDAVTVGVWCLLVGLVGGGVIAKILHGPRSVGHRGPDQAGPGVELPRGGSPQGPPVVLPKGTSSDYARPGVAPPPPRPATGVLHVRHHHDDGLLTGYMLGSMHGSHTTLPEPAPDSTPCADPPPAAEDRPAPSEAFHKAADIEVDTGCSAGFSEPGPAPSSPDSGGNYDAGGGCGE